MELNCKFFNLESYLNGNSQYICKVEGVTRIANNGRVLSITGKHAENFSNMDVDTFICNDINIKYFPRYLCKFFPNLTSIKILKGGIDYLSYFDFIGFENITQLMIYGNPLECLESDLFQFAPNIEVLSLLANEITYIGQTTFDKMKNLKHVNLKLNKSIDVCYKQIGNGLKTIEELKEAIEEMMLKKIWESKEEGPNFVDSIELNQENYGRV
jgi:hypothetical protein